MRKMCLDTEPLPDLLEPGLRKKTHVQDSRNVGYLPLLKEQSPQTPYKRPCDQTTRRPHHKCTQELWKHSAWTRTGTMEQRDAAGSMVVTISCNLIAFYGGMTGWVDEGRAVDVVYLDFTKAIDTVSHNILLGKIRKCGLVE